MRLAAVLVLSLSLVASAIVAACGDGGQGAAPTGEQCPVLGFRCTTQGCAANPTLAGCRDVVPTAGACPFELPRCIDPTDDKHFRYYCDPAISVCAKYKVPLPRPCPDRNCSLADVKVCYDVNDDIFCRDEYRCTYFLCTQDAGAPPDASSSDGL